MGFSNVALKDKITEMYPDISRHRISLGLAYHKEKGAYQIKFKKDSHELSTYLEKEEADECMEGHKCVHLGLKLAEFINNFNA